MLTASRMAHWSAAAPMKLQSASLAPLSLRSLGAPRPNHAPLQEVMGWNGVVQQHPTERAWLLQTRMSHPTLVLSLALRKKNQSRSTTPSDSAPRRLVFLSLSRSPHEMWNGKIKSADKYLVCYTAPMMMSCSTVWPRFSMSLASAGSRSFAIPAVCPSPSSSMR